MSQDLLQAIERLCDRGARFAVVSVLHAEGSTPCNAGAKAVVHADGAIQGTVGGGAVEAEAQRRAVEAIKTGRPVVFAFNLEGGAVNGGTPLCGGTMRVLVDPTAARYQATYTAAAESRTRRERGVLLTTICGSEACEVSVQFLAESAIPLDVAFPGPEGIRLALKHEETELFVSEAAQGGQPLEVLVEPLIPKPRLLIVGGGHIGQALALQASLVGFDIVVLDDRTEFTRPELFPKEVTTRCSHIREEVAAFPTGTDTFIVIVTRGHQHDADALAACLRKPAAYIGMIGSRRKVALMRQEFLASGRATAAEFDRVYAPIGLDIGSVTVPEIAASIVAQLIAVRRKGSASRIPAA